jgi:hypothetical protein
MIKIQTTDQQNMNKLQNRGMRNRKREGTMTPQKANNHKIEDLVESEWDGTCF